VFSILPARGQTAGRKLKAALIGCGGRGTDAMRNCQAAARHLGVDLEIVALADYFEKRLKSAASAFGVDAARCYGGASGYRRVMESAAEVVLMATPPIFRPLHFEAAVAAGKHVFVEKPVAVDPPGARRMMAAGMAAAKKGLSAVAGTQRRYATRYLANAEAVRSGAIGRILGGQICWMGGRLWFKNRQPGESDADYMIRNWVSFCETSGDHIVEQHVHNLDIANWFIGRPPVSAIGMGGRARRKTGNQYDFFSVDFDYGDDCHVHSQCRQVNGAYQRNQELFQGTEGTAYGGGVIRRFDGRAVTRTAPGLTDPEELVQEHVELLRGILAGPPVQRIREVTEATLAAIMGRISAYTGQVVRWSDLATNESSPFYALALAPAPEDFEKGTVRAPPDDVVPIPGA
jgi:predicted dehydrogenase